MMMFDNRVLNNLVMTIMMIKICLEGMVHGMLVEVHRLDVMLVIVLMIKFMMVRIIMSRLFVIVTIVMEQFMRLFVLVAVLVLKEMTSMILSWLFKKVS